MQYKIRQIREKKSLSQETLANMAGISRTTISLIETGAANDVKIETLSKIAGALGCNISDLFMF